MGFAQTEHIEKRGWLSGPIDRDEEDSRCPASHNAARCPASHNAVNGIVLISGPITIKHRHN
jgi:hypothetical protein